MRGWLINYKLAIANLKATRVRTALTILGIVVGVCSVTTVLALGQGASDAVNQKAATDSGDTLAVRPGELQVGDPTKLINYNPLALTSVDSLTEKDLEIVTHVEGAVAAPLMLIPGTVSAGDKQAANASIIATDKDISYVYGLQLRAGDFIGDDTESDTVVLGRNLAIDLLGSDSTIGQTVSLHGETFTVRGILASNKLSEGANTAVDLNYAALITLARGKQFHKGTAQIQQISVRTAKGYETSQVADTLRQKLKASHNGEEDFTIITPQDAARLTNRVYSFMTGFTAVVASISVLVGGIGIMNIMLVSVSERTREVGIRKAVGATNRQVMSQFLIEALIMSGLGGVIGVLFGYILAYIVSTALGFLPGISYSIPLIALGVSLVVGLLFGTWPALKASRKDPIEALRHSH